MVTVERSEKSHAGGSRDQVSHHSVEGAYILLRAGQWNGREWGHGKTTRLPMGRKHHKN